MVRTLIAASLFICLLLVGLGCDLETNGTTTGAPSVTTNTAEIATAGDSAVLKGELTDLGTASNVQVSFQWGTSSSSYSQETPVETQTATGAFSHEITGLNANTTYYFRAKAVGDDTSYGSQKNFKTPEAAKLTILSHEMDTSGYYLKIVGQAKNTGSETLSFASVDVKFRDAGGAVLDTSLDTITNLAPDDIWNFEVICLQDESEVASYEISVGTVIVL